MYQFNSPQFLWFLLLIIPWSLYTFFKKREGFEWLFTHLALIALILGLSGLEFGEERLKKSTSNCRLIIALDVSKSMMAEDVLPSRFHEASKVLQRIVPEVQCEIALYPFTTRGHLLIPPTSDSQHILESLINLSPLDFTNQGTDFSESLDMLSTHIRTLQRNTKTTAKYSVLLLSDGESHTKVTEGSLSFFKKNHIPIYTFAVGTQQGITLTIRNSRILTKLNPLILQKISLWTHGKFYTSSNIEKLHKEFSGDSISLETTFEIKKNYSQILYIIAFILLCGAFLRTRWEYAIRSFLFVCLLQNSSFSQSEKTDIELYNEATVKEQDFYLPKALELYEEALNLTSQDKLKRKILFNMGNSYFKMSQFDKALEAYQQAMSVETSEPSTKTISENIQLAYKKLKEQMKSKKQDKPSDKKESEQSIHDKEKIYKHIKQQEEQTQQRLNRNKQTNEESKTPW